jgi:hypothetical protein
MFSRSARQVVVARQKQFANPSVTHVFGPGQNGTEFGVACAEFAV